MTNKYLQNMKHQDIKIFLFEDQGFSQIMYWFVVLRVLFFASPVFTSLDCVLLTWHSIFKFYKPWRA